MASPRSTSITVNINRDAATTITVTSTTPTSTTITITPTISGTQTLTVAPIVSAPKPITVTISFLTGKSITFFDIAPTSTVADLKKRIQDREGTVPDMQRLIYCGKQFFKENATLQDVSHMSQERWTMVNEG